MIQFDKASLSELIDKAGHDCACGKHHRVDMDYLSIRSGAVEDIPAALKAMGVNRPFVVGDVNTLGAAWPQVKAVLDAAQVPYKLYCFPMERVEPDERAVGALTMAFDPACDCIMGVGSGVVNDCCKVLAHAVGRKQMIVGTAPSMDGYASNSSSMIQNRIKVSLMNAAPNAIVCDIDVIRQAPMRMLWAGLGDMLAKFVATCEWRISHLVTGEYYCENIAALMRASLERIVRSAGGLKQRDPAAVQATVEGLVLSGIAMSFAEISRPASGLEHYFSHLWEMMALDRDLPGELHGLQVGVGTLLTLRLYDDIRHLKPDRAHAEAFIAAFSNERWEQDVRRIFGKAAEAIIRAEHETIHNNDPAGHARRLERILAHWKDILRIADEELPPAEDIAAVMRDLGMPMTPEDVGVSRQDAVDALMGSRDIRRKYLTSTLLWDLGVLYETDLPR